tara:strand:- start:35 stop:376 length:342 start_codon:yes stop_codon:yes gene_type:complete
MIIENFIHYVIIMEELLSINERETKSYTLLFFTASWCEPCKKIYPFVEEIQSKIDNSILSVQKIDIDNDNPLISIHNVRSVPTFVLLCNNEYVDKITGSDKNKLVELLKNIQI